MNQENNQNNITVGNSLIEFVTVIIKHRYFLFVFIFSITFIMTVYALISPKWYRSTASVLPTEGADLLSSLSGLSSLVKGFSATKGLASLTGANESDKYLAILRSATITDQIIREFNLREVYDLEDTYYEKVVKELESNTDFEIQDEGHLTISVLDKDPQRAADIANRYVELLNGVNTDLHVQNAKANREFIEKRYNKNISDIKDLEDSMRYFQEKYGVVAVPEQIETTVAAMATIYGQLAEKELELSIIQQTLTGNHPLVSLTEIEVNQLKKKIREMNSSAVFKQDDINLLIPFKKAPELASKYLKIFRDTEIQYKILEIITPLYEQAKVEEVRSTPSVVVLDRAGPAERKAKPKGSLYALVSFTVSLIIGVFIIFSIELIDKFKLYYPSRYEYITGWIREDLKFFFSKEKKK